MHSARRVTLVGLLLGSLVLGPLGAAAGVLLGARSADREAARTAQAALDRGDFATALGIDRALASRGGPLHLLGRADIAAASANAQQAQLRWAEALARSGETDRALAELAGVTDPALRDDGRAARALALLDGSKRSAAAGHFDVALARLDELAAGGGPAPVLAEGTALRPADLIGWSAALLAAGRPNDAVSALDHAIGSGQPEATTRARAALPAALLASGRADLDARDSLNSRNELTRLIKDFPSSSEARVASDILDRGLSVTGTLVDRNGVPESTAVRIGTNFRQLPGGYGTSPPYRSTRSDRNGDFLFTEVPAGGPYVLEFQRNGGWSTVIDSRSGGPGAQLTLTALDPGDFGFVVVPT